MRIVIVLAVLITCAIAQDDHPAHYSPPLKTSKCAVPSKPVYKPVPTSATLTTQAKPGLVTAQATRPTSVSTTKPPLTKTTKKQGKRRRLRVIQKECYTL